MHNLQKINPPLLSWHI